MKKTVQERFWSKVDRSAGDDGCWRWTAAKDHNGYGLFWIDGRSQRAHRISYVLAVGAIPEGMELDHICHVRHCVNTAHLRPVTHKQNVEHHAGAQQNSSSGVRGVYWHKQSSRWRVQVTHHGKCIHVGHFDSLAEAEAAAIAKRNELYTHNDVDRRASAQREMPSRKDWASTSHMSTSARTTASDSVDHTAAATPRKAPNTAAVGA